MLVSVSGLIGSGKDTIADFLVQDHGFVRMSFAAALKDVVATVFGWDRELLEGRSEESRNWREQIDPWWATRLGIPHLTPRWVLQQWGTEVLRRNFHDDIWVAALERRLLTASASVVITDARFPNELSVVRNNGGKNLLVKRGPDPDWYDAAIRTNLENSNEMLMRSDVHPSEWSWVGRDFDYTVYNNSTIEKLHESINEIACKKS